MAERDVRERDILVAPGEYAYVQDLTKGDIVLYCGPTKISLSNTERMILYRDGRFVPVKGDEAGLGVSRVTEATSAQYIVLENPPKDPSLTPTKGANSAIELLVGRKIVVPGPVQFPLWPGQRAKVVDGHALRQNEYLVVRVYDTLANDDAPIGSERIIRGTDVSFYVPSTGLEVVPHRGEYVRKAWRLEKNRGLHVRVVKPYDAAEGDMLPAGHYAAGRDIFLRNVEGYFFPTSSLEVVAEVSPTPLAEKEGVYVRRLDTGAIQTIVGPQSYLPDPTHEEIVTRSLDAETEERYGVIDAPAHLAPAIYVPPSTAVLITAKNRREVVIGPQTRILDHDEVLEELTLSTGRPKRDENLLATCSLQIEGNKVSDVVTVTTADHVALEVLVSYRVSFVGEPERWFAVRNYVGLLCDHLGSLIRAVARGVAIDDFNQQSTAIVRDIVLGGKTTEGRREGRHFSENGMWVYDLEVLSVAILDEEVEEMLATAQRQTIESEIARKREARRLGDQRVRESVNQEIFAAQVETTQRAAELDAVQQKRSRLEAEHNSALAHLLALGEARADADAMTLRESAAHQAAARAAEIERVRLEARAKAFEQEMGALAPELISTLKTLGNQRMAAELSANLSPLAILGGESVAAVAERLLDKLPLGPRAGNGADSLRALLAGSFASSNDALADE